MTGSDPSAPPGEAQWLAAIRTTQERGSTEPSAEHDAAVLAAARAAGAEIRSRRFGRSHSSAWLPVSLAAALVLGIAIGRSSWLLAPLGPPVMQLTVPTHSPVRGASGTVEAAANGSIPVEQANPAEWYRYIQELVFSGQTELAEAHLRRFRELHPDFVYQP